ncbi:MAG: metallophosphoesterase family protein [Chloroflexota bacterium]
MLVAVLSDVHGNLAALQAVLADVPAVDEFWCLGDLVGYGPEPNGCIETILGLKHLALAGNHDWAAVGKIATDTFNADARRAAEWTANQLTPANRNVLLGLPTELVVGEFTLVHGSPRDPIWEYILAGGQAAANLDHFSTPYCLVGHTHLPLVYLGPWGEEAAQLARPTPDLPLALAERRLIVNPGSVGQPRDGDPRAAYAVVDLAARTLVFKRVAYDVAATQEKMRRAGLPERLAARLTFGW